MPAQSTRGRRPRGAKVIEELDPDWGGGFDDGTTQ